MSLILIILTECGLWCVAIQVDGYKLGHQGTKLIYKGACKCTLGWLSRYNLVYLLPTVNLVLRV